MKQLFFIAAIAVSVSGAAQKVTNKLTFPKGQKLEVSTQVNSVVSQEAMGQTFDMTMKANIVRLLDVEDATANSATIEHKVKRIQVDVDIPMMGSKTFDSEKEADLKGEGGKAFEKALKNKYKMTVDANGKVTAVKADDNNPDKAEKGSEEDMMSTMADQLGLGLSTPTVGEASEFAILPNREVSKGESWSDSTSTNDEKVKTTYTVSDITDGEIIVNFTATGNAKIKQENMGMEVTVNKTDNATGKIVLDRKTGLLKTRTETVETTGTTEVMGQSMPLKGKTTKTTVVKAA
ncbi:MAG: DUF6263 family protein [Bacteroidota bacterium]|nr:hypothetical protein [Flavisolibacter sp.]MBD0295909.1 hypothetical protein [Flavisolibacter sp.]MDQ3844184.1 DUF6263 family protein [Bacteroidota bacterium]